MNKIYLEPYGLSNINVFVVSMVDKIADITKDIVDRQTPVIKDNKELFIFNNELLEPSQIFMKLCDYYMPFNKIDNNVKEIE